MSCSLESLDQLTWGEISGTLGNGLHFLTFSLPPLAGQGVMAIPTAEALAIVDLRLAGTGEEEYPERVLTEIEQELLVPVAEGILDELANSLLPAPAHHADPRHARGEHPVRDRGPPDRDLPGRPRRRSPSGTAPSASIVLCLPFVMMRQLAEVMRTRPGHLGEGVAASQAMDVRHRLHDVPLDLVVQFPTFNSTPDTLMTLAVGDELHLGPPDRSTARSAG